ncbi:hypothetical protein GWK47_022629 [Chionoecetes opilio]|uniref:MADF domain-containing protein n=1 Tax=Chionoecetes opilio TaxID=41210 RepID=A0A8J4XNI4_CHIOP|nr:hypothetical protein GWK47_022629 [Chionoecetes opilio]
MFDLLYNAENQSDLEAGRSSAAAATFSSQPAPVPNHVTDDVRSRSSKGMEEEEEEEEEECSSQTSAVSKHNWIVIHTGTGDTNVFILLMAGRGRGRGRVKKQSPKKPSSSKSSSKLPSKQSCRKKKDPPPPSPHLPSADESASSHHEEEPDSHRSLSRTHGRARSAFPTSRPSSPVGSLASDGDGPGEEEHAAKKKTTKKPKKTRKDCKISDQDVEDDLVEWFSENDSLWNTQRTAYRDKARRQRLLATKAEQLGISSEHLWTWFKSLRDMFTRLDKKKSGDGQPTFTEREKWIREKFKFFQRAIYHRSKPVKSMKAIIAQSEGNLDEAERAAAEHVEVDDDGRELPTTSGSSKSSKDKRSSEPHPEIDALQKKKAKESGEIVEVLYYQILSPEPVNDRTTFSAYVKSTLIGLSDSDFRRARKGINKVLAIFLESSSEDEFPSIAPRRQPTATVTVTKRVITSPTCDQDQSE